MQTDLTLNLEECETNTQLNLSSWSDINWKKVNRDVTDLRARIFACRRKGDYKKLRNLQRLMISSASNTLFSIRRVCGSKGRLSPGVDGQIVTTPKQRLNLFHSIMRMDISGFQPRPARRIHILKPDGSPRPIGIPTILDRIIQGIIKNALEPEWEALFEGYSYGFRPGRSVNDAVARVRSILIPKRRVWVLEVDTAKCFDSLSHEHILKQVAHFPARDLISRWLTCGIFLDGVWLDTLTGTPQGGVLSPLLCNIAMHGLGEELGIKTNSDGRVRSSSPCSMVVYADDMVILTDSYHACVEIKARLSECLSSRGLRLNDTKTKISHAYQGFDFLGFNFKICPRFGRYYARWFNDNGVIKLACPADWFSPIVSPSEKGINSVKDKLRLLFHSHKTAPADLLIMRANRIIRGWANAKRFWYVWPTFKQLDFFVWNLIRRWMHRRHPNKGTRWRNSKYFSLEKRPDLGYRDKWTFRDERTLRPLLKFYWFFSRTGIKKEWVQIASSMCPDDKSPIAKVYFSNRQVDLFDRKLVDLTGKLDRAIAKRQKLTCPICSDSLFNGEHLHRHHIIQKSAGGSDSPSNLCLVHLTCHYRVHHASDRPYLDSLLNATTTDMTQPSTHDAIDPIASAMDGFLD